MFAGFSHAAADSSSGSYSAGSAPTASYTAGTGSAATDSYGSQGSSYGASVPSRQLNSGYGAGSSSAYGGGGGSYGMGSGMGGGTGGDITAPFGYSSGYGYGYRRYIPIPWWIWYPTSIMYNKGYGYGIGKKKNGKNLWNGSWPFLALFCAEKFRICLPVLASCIFLVAFWTAQQGKATFRVPITVSCENTLLVSHTHNPD